MVQQIGIEYLTVGQAAEFLGISPWTLRNWDKAGRLKPRRHPTNGYRIYRMEDLQAILGPDEAAGKPNDRLTPRLDWSDIGETEHFAQFYESDAFLMDSVAGFMSTALSGGDSSIVIATPAHSRGIERRLKAQGIDLAVASASGRFISLDAAETLAQFMVEGFPDPARFTQIVGAIVDKAALRGGRVRAFGEMVALLWAEGNQAGAIRLEELWNGLAQSRRFALFCAYPMQGFAGQTQGEPFTSVCTCHSRVIPAESYASLPSAEQRLREIALLQQKAQSLEAEIAQRRQAEAALRASEEQYRTMMELLPAAVCCCEAPSGIIRYYNRRAADLWGCEPKINSETDRLPGAVRAFSTDGTPLQQASSPMARVLNGGAPVRNEEVIIERPDKTRITVMVNIDPILDASARVVGAVNVFQDVTERKQLEEELRQAKAGAEDASRAKDQFLAVLSHELRTPLTPVLMSIAAMETEAGLPQRMREDLEMIRRNIGLETRLIDDLLDLSRVVNGKMILHMQDLHVHPIIRNVVEMVAAEAKAKLLNVSVQLEARQDLVHADSARLHQVVWNLLNNAIKFTPQRGTINLRTFDLENHRLAIEVRDSGIGIQPDALPNIFNAFDQGHLGRDRAFGGLGLGLAICKSVVEMHGGAIRAQSGGPDQGSRFTVELSLAAEKSKTKAKAVPADHGGGDGRSSLRVLLVDDHLDTLRVMRRLLELKGQHVVTASSVMEAIRAAEAHSFDILISDIGLPDGTGLDVVRQVRLRHPRLPAIALTGFGTEQDIDNIQQAGFSAHLTKPVSMATLETAIRELARAALEPSSR